MTRRYAIALAALLLLLFTCGCSLGSQGMIVRYDISDPVTNLDPQFATDANARMIIGNLYEGLMIQGADGEILPGAAESYTRSSDGLTYTFRLREGVCWSDGTPLTAHDFTFAFQRLFGTGALSPYASYYVCIQNASSILQGSSNTAALGVSAPDDWTVVFALDYASPFFLELLSATPAMPCNEEAFLESRGRYGLETAAVFSNGPFTLTRWDNSTSIQIRKSDSYVSDQPTIAGGVNFYVGRENPAGQFTDGNSDLAVVPFSRASALQGSVSSLESFDKSTWCIVFNQNDPVLGNALIRQGLCHMLDSAELDNLLASGFSATRVLVPPAIKLVEESYRDLVGSESPLAHDTQQGILLFHLGLESMELETVPQMTLLVPDDADHDLYLGPLQQEWQKYLSAYVTIESLPISTIEERFRNGNYQMLLMPFSPATGQAHSLLDAFTSTSGQNYTSYRSQRYDGALLAAVGQPTVEATAEAYHYAEQILLSDAVVLPVYYENTTYAVADKVSGIEIAPFAGHIYFKYAQKS